MKTNHKTVAVQFFVLFALMCSAASAQIVTGDELHKVIPKSFFYDGQSAPVQERNSIALKNSSGKFTLAGLVDTSGYSTGIAEKYQGFLITETKLSFDGATLEPGAYGFGFREGKFTVMKRGRYRHFLDRQQRRRSAQTSRSTEVGKRWRRLSPVCRPQVCGGKSGLRAGIQSLRASARNPASLAVPPKGLSGAVFELPVPG